MSKILRLSFVAFLVLTFSAIAFGQSTTTGAIGGVVSDPNKAVIPGASVTIKNTGTNKEDTAKTDDQGRFRIVNLDPGTYDVTISAGSFSPFNQKVIVEVGRVTDVNAELSIGAQGGTVEVGIEAPVINTSQQDFTTNMNQTSINELPINGQRWSNFALLAPGSVPDGNFGLISFRGISGILNNNTIDGGDNNQAFFSEERGRTRLSYTVSQAAIREFQINTANYSAEYGRAAGAVVNAVTKSGTNEFHGNAFFYDRNNKWGARNPLGFRFDLPTVPAFKPEDVRYKWGGSIGGPIKKDKAFFFFNYDEQRRNFPGLGIFSNAAYLSTVNQCTSATDPTGGPNGTACTSTLFAASLKNPSRGLTDAQIGGVKNFISSLAGPVPRRGNQRIFLPKVDVRLGENHTLTATYNRLRWASPAGIQTQPTNTRGRASFGDDFVNGDTLNVRLASTFGANMVNEARFQYGRDNEFEFSQPALPGEPTTAQNSRSPDVFLTGGLEFGKPTFLERVAQPDEKRWQYADTVTLTIGNHTVKFGGDVNHVKDLQDNLSTESGSYSYSNINDFIIDYLHFGTPTLTTVCSSSTRVAGRCYTSSYQQGFGPTRFQFATNDYNFFIQDDWRYTPHLTVNIGIRYEYERLPDPFLALAFIPQESQLPKDKNNFGPRIGFAWDMSGDGKNALRGGYGIYYGRILNGTILNSLVNTGNSGGQVLSSFLTSDPTCTSSSGTNAGGIRCAPAFPNILTSGAAGASGIQFFMNHFQAPAIHQMDLIYEREIAKNTVISGSLLMSFGRRLQTFVDTNLNQPVGSFNVTSGANTFNVNPTYTIVDGPFAGQTYTVPLFTGNRPNASFGAMSEIRSIVSSTYYGFVAQLNRRLTKGLQMSINYTRSRARDDGQNSLPFTANNSPFNAFDPLGERGRSNFDIPHKFIANAVYSPHFNSTSKAARMILNNWTLSPIIAAYSGVPYTPTISGSFPTSCASSAGCTTIGGVAASGPSVFTQAGGQNGSAGATRFALVGRNTFRFPKIVNVDMRVSRRIRFNEATALEFLVEGFNVFNRTQVTGLNTAIYATGGTYQKPTLTLVNNFGGVNAAGGTLYRERQIQLAVRFEF